MRKNEFSVLIPDGESQHAITVLRCLKQMKNVTVFILSANRGSMVRFSRYCNRFISYTDGNRPETRLNAIYDAIEKLKPDVVLPVDVETISLLAANKENLSKLTSVVPLPSTDAFQIANHKGLLSQWAKQNEIPCPPTLLFKKNDAEFDEALSTFSFPVLLKPCDGFGGEGIEIFENLKDFKNYCKNHTSSRQYILQSFIKGYDQDCSVLCDNGKILAYTMQKGFIDGNTKFRRADGIDLFYDSKAHQLVSRIVEKLHWTGIAHMDLRYDEEDEEVKLIEINPRYWGSLLGSLCSGVNFPYLACLVGLNRDLVKSEIKPMRYIQGKAAVKIMAKMLLSRKIEETDIKTSFKFILKDPLPSIMHGFQMVK